MVLCYIRRAGESFNRCLENEAFYILFNFQIPFSLCLRVWDIYLLEGEKVATAMAYTVLKVHKNKLLKLKVKYFENFQVLKAVTNYKITQSRNLYSILLMVYFT